MRPPPGRAWTALRAARGRLSAGLLPYLVLAFVFVASRVVYRAHFEVAFDSTPLESFIQYVPLWILKHDFWRSILYLYQQAPLQNLLAGGLWVALGPDRAAPVLEAIYLGFGFTFATCLLASMRRLGVGPVLATIAVSLYAASPVTVLYECWLFYPMPVVTFLGLSLYALLRFYETPTYRWGVVFFSMLAITALFRSIYGVVWMGATLLALAIRPPALLGHPEAATARVDRTSVWWKRWLFLPSSRRTLALAALLPIAAVAANNIKTSILVGRSAGSEMLWANIPTKIWQFIPSPEQERLKSEHLLSEEISYEPITQYHKLKNIPHQESGVPLLDLAVTPDGERNYHTLEYLFVTETYNKPDGRYLLEHYPGAYLDSVLEGFRDWYCSSPTRDIVLGRSNNAKRLRPLLDLTEDWAGKSRTGSLKALKLGLPLCLVYGLYRLGRSASRRESERGTIGALLFMMLTIAYTSLGTVMISYGDFSRYRFDVDPFYYILFALCLQDRPRVSRILRAVAQSVMARRSRRRPPPPGHSGKPGEPLAGGSLP